MGKHIAAVCVACWLIGQAACADAATLLSLDSHGDFIGQGVVDVFDESDGTFTLASPDLRSIVFEFVGDGNVAYGLIFQAPEGQALAPGNYEDAYLWQDDSPLNPNVQAFSFGHTCTANLGRFVVRELVRDSGSGQVTSFAADFEHYCSFGALDLPLFGSLRFRSDVPLDLAEPTAAAGADQVALERDAVVLDGRHSMPGSSAITTWHWRQISGPPVTLTDPDASIASFMAPAVAAPGEMLQFELQTANGNGLADTDVVDVFVQNRISPRNFALLIGDGAIGELPTNQQLLLLPQDGLFDVADFGEGRSKMHLRWRGIGYDWFFNLIDDIPLAVGHYDVDSDLGQPRTDVTAAFTGCGNRVQGSFDILDIAFSGDLVSRIALNFVQYCDFLPVPLRGKVRFNVAIPDANAGPDLDVEGGSPVALSSTASRSAVGVLEEFRWRQISGPVVTLQGASLASASFTAPNVAATTTLTFELTVIDDRGIDDSDIVAVEVTPSSSPPPPPPPPPPQGNGGGGGGGANWAALAMLALLGHLRRKNREHVKA